MAALKEGDFRSHGEKRMGKPARERRVSVDPGESIQHMVLR